MARTRNIKPDFFKNEELVECSPYARLVFIGLWCHSDCMGRLQDRPKKLKVELLPYENVEFVELLDELVEHGFITRYEVDGQKYIEVTNFVKHQSPHIQEPGIYPPPPGGEVHKPHKKKELSTGKATKNKVSEKPKKSSVGAGSIEVVNQEKSTVTDDYPDESVQAPDLHRASSPLYLTPYTLSLNALSLTPKSADEEQGLVESTDELGEGEKQPDGARLDLSAQITAEYNKICFMLPQAQKLTAARLMAIKPFYQEVGGTLEAVRSYFTKVSKCPHLIGKGQSGWRASFDWLLEPDNVAKVLEGNYDRNVGEGSKGQTLAGAKLTKSNRFNDFASNRSYSNEMLESKLNIMGLNQRGSNHADDKMRNTQRM